MCYINVCCTYKTVIRPLPVTSETVNDYYCYYCYEWIWNDYTEMYRNQREIVCDDESNLFQEKRNKKKERKVSNGRISEEE